MSVTDKTMRLDQPQTVRLTQHVRAGGCASKLPAGSLRQVLSALPAQTDPDLLVGFETSDDAGIFRIGPKQALVQTIDFFTPLVDDPFTFGQIAATNALSDVYAMGGRPLTALAAVCFPQDADLAILEQIMRGGLAKMTEAKCSVVGGHSVRDAEMKFGYAVTGLIDPARVYTNAGALPGDTLILTKPIGTGVITTALKQGKSEPAWVDRSIRSMTTLNCIASTIAISNSGVHAITDITGFGLMGHGREMALGSGVVIEIETARVPLIEGALDAVRAGAIPGGLISNREFAECMVADAPGSRIPDDLRKLLYDPQTSGGLLISVASESASALLASLHAAGLPAAIVGRVSGPFAADAGRPTIILQ
jgi:selenide,water dikinase